MRSLVKITSIQGIEIHVCYFHFHIKFSDFCTGWPFPVVSQTLFFCRKNKRIFSDNKFLTLSTVGTTSVSGLYDLHVVLQDYGDSGISPLTQEIQCSIETSDCDGGIQIVAKDLRLFSEGGQCYQNLSINETGLNYVQTFSCSYNTNFIQNLNFYISKTNHIILTFKNSYSKSGGYLWIQVLPGIQVVI